MSLNNLLIASKLASIGRKVGKLIDINIEDVDFENRKCLVGTKEKSVSFDARTKIHLKNYLKN